jgi:CRP-like cAMP-binding protein
MMQKFTQEDIEKFLEIYEASISDDETQSLKKLISVQDKISIFKGIAPEDLAAIVYGLKFVRYTYKDFVIRQNEKKEEIFYIMDGECQVFHYRNRVGKLHAGEVFGEMAAIFGTKRNASVLCSTKNMTLLSFCIDHKNIEFYSVALAQLYKNLAFQMNAKLEESNAKSSKK